MEKVVIDKILKITTGVTIFLLLLILFNSDTMTVKEVLRKLLSIVSFVVLFWTFYFSYGWKWPLMKYLVFKENLNGTWFGEYSSRDSVKDATYQGQISIVIRQSFLNINVVSYTEKYVSFSYGEAVLHDRNNSNDQLVYLYSQNQYDPTDNLSRKGTSELLLLKEDTEKKLFGEFWTNHNSKGSLKLRKISSEHLTSFKDAERASV